MAHPDPRELLREMFDAAVAAAQPARCVPPHLPAPSAAGRTVVVGAGKAAATMARAVEDHWRQTAPTANYTGLVITRYGHAVPCDNIAVVEAAHPVPDQAGLDATARIVDMVAGLGADDLVLCLISGGGSALLTAPAQGIDFADKQALTDSLLRSGATIDEMNCVRKHLSAVKGGRLAAAAAPARVVTLAISDVPGDDPSVIASGPTVPDPTTVADARAVLARYDLTPPPAVARHLDRNDETPKPGSLPNATFQLVAAPLASLKAAAGVATGHGVTPLILGDALEGEARELGRGLAGIAASVALNALPVASPAVILSGGETTVTVTGTGVGGRNSEFALGLAVELAGRPDVYAIAADTDGIDGAGDNAGVIVAPDSLARARAKGLDARALLADNDVLAFFSALDDLVVTGPTHTNVNDFRAIFIGAP